MKTMDTRGRAWARFVTRNEDERGAYAVLAALVLVLVIAFAAISVDIARQVDSRQSLEDAMDVVAHSGAFDLKDGIGAALAASREAALREGGIDNLTLDTWCVVSATSDGKVRVTDIGVTCDPGAGPPYTAANPQYPGLVCDEVRCFIPCRTDLFPAAKCNTMRARGENTVDYKFAPAIGYDRGSTGSVVSMACLGSCGGGNPNPLNITIMADRTASMSLENRELMKKAILDSLETMDPHMHHVSFGALHKSRTSGFTHKSKFVRPDAPAVPSYENCQASGMGRTENQSVRTGNWPRYTYTTVRVWVPNASGLACEQRNRDREEAYQAARAEWQVMNAEYEETATKAGWDGNGDRNGDGICRTEAERVARWSGGASSSRSQGVWVPLALTNDYLTSEGSVNPNSVLVDGISCLGESTTGEYGTHLAGALKGAANYLLSGPRVTGALPRPEGVRDVIIFETDGMPDEVGSAGGSTLLNVAGDVFGGQQSGSSTNGETSCANFLDVARQAKARGILIITIGFGDANTAGCRKHSSTSSSGTKVRDVLAQAASPKAPGQPSTAGECGNDAQIAAENTDGDYFYCAARGEELASIFTTALTSVSKGIKLLRMPS